MPKQSFRIVMKTSIGERCGTMTAEWEEGILRGIMTILEQTNAFSGKIDEDGNCCMEGQMVSPVRTIPYIAIGILTLAKLQLSIQEGRNIFELIGVPYFEKGETNS